MPVQPLPRRQQEVLKATVHHYVDTIEPVGSRTLVQRFDLHASAATVRSAMGALEQRGLLTQPHTSAGRVPSPSVHRFAIENNSTMTDFELEYQLSWSWSILLQEY